MAYWEDRISSDAWNRVSKTLEQFKKSRKTQEDQHVAYDSLTNAGLTGEEADEMINLELQSE